MAGQETTAGARSSRPGTMWLLALLPVLPLLLVFSAYELPANADGAVMPLAGEWSGHVATDGFDPFGADSSAWRPLRLPGGFTPQGLTGGHAFVRRTFAPLPAMVGHDASFVIGSVRGATVRLFFNGQPIGLKGEPSRHFIGLEAGAETFFIPARLIRPDQNVLTLEVKGHSAGRDGITDPRLLFGRHDVLGPWSFHEQQLRSVLEHGSLLLIAFLAVLLVALWVLQADRANRDLYRSTLVLLAAAVGYLLGKSGFVVSALGGRAQVMLIVVSVHLLGLGIVEFIEAYYLGRVTWFRHVNRVVSVLAVVLSLAGLHLVYRVYVNWLFVMVVYSLALAVRDLVKGKALFGPLVVVATFIVAGSGISDLLGDLDLIYAPRLFTFAIANLAAMSGAVVVGEFVELARENTRLSRSLQQRAEELSAALVKAEEGSRIKSEFLANTSHELRTPLNAIINIPQGLLEQIHEVRRARCGACGALFELEPGESVDQSACPSCQQQKLALEQTLTMELGAEETARLLKSIVRSGTHLLAVVNDILDYSKLEAGRVVLHREKVSVTTLLDDLKLAMEPVAARAGVKLEVNSVEATLDADRVKLSQVLINLVGNAIKFSDGKGTVTVSASATAERVSLSVRDEGIGIAPEHQALIFEGFRQVEGSNTRRFGGSGLGLAISKRLVTMHGGSVRVESAVGQGSTFIVELPLVAPAVEQVEQPDAQVVVVVDDESVAVDTTSVALRPLGCRVVAVTDPRLALERLRAARPSLLILDVMMPRVSGLELLREVKHDPLLASLPVLVSSAYPDNQLAAEALGATFIAKPWQPGELLRVASSLLARAPQRSPS